MKKSKSKEASYSLVYRNDDDETTLHGQWQCQSQSPRRSRCNITGEKPAQG